MRADIDCTAKVRKVRVFCLLVIAFGLLVIIVRIHFENESYRKCESHSQASVINNESNEQNASIDVSTGTAWDYNWDLKANEEHGKGERSLILIRHGNYNFQTGKLTQLGREQVEMTAQRLRRMNLTYVSITHSTLERAVETAEIIRSQLPHVAVTPDSMLVEGGPVPPNPTISYWRLPDRSYFVDGPRMEACFRKYFYRSDKMDNENTNQILVGHGNIFRFFVLRALQLSKDAWMRVFIAHASITRLHIRPDGTVAMTLFGDAGHFPSDRITY